MKLTKGEYEVLELAMKAIDGVFTLSPSEIMKAYESVLAKGYIRMYRKSKHEICLTITPTGIKVLGAHFNSPEHEIQAAIEWLKGLKCYDGG